MTVFLPTPVTTLSNSQMTQLWWDSSPGVGGESVYRDEVVLNTAKTKELIIDFIRIKMTIPPLSISGDCVERDPSFWFLGVEIKDNL